MKNTVNSKTILRIVGFITLAVVIGFSMASCGGEDDGGGGGDSNTPLTWTTVSKPFVLKDVNVTFGGGKFVALGSVSGNAPLDRYAYSNDNGVTWTLGTSISSWIIAYGGGRFVTNAGYSTDGVEWTILSSYNQSPVSRAITYGGDKFVTVGWIGYSPSRPGIAYSSNGANWGSATHPFTSTDKLNCVAYGADKFVTGGENGIMAYSSDGITWTAVANSTFGTSNINCITYGAGKFVAAGDSGKIAFSTDGITWTAVTTSPLGSSKINCIAYG